MGSHTLELSVLEASWAWAPRRSFVRSFLQPSNQPHQGRLAWPLEFTGRWSLWGSA